MRVRRHAMVGRDAGDVWAALATGVPVVTRLWKRGQLSTRTGQLPEPGALMHIVDGVSGESGGGTARISAYRPPRHVSWAVAEQTPLFGAVSGSYRISGDGPSTVELQLVTGQRSLLGVLLAPVQWLLLRRLADELLSDLVGSVASRPPLPVVAHDRGAIAIEPEPVSDGVVEERLSQGRVYAFRISRSVLVALRDDAQGPGRPGLSAPTRQAMTRALQSLAKDADSRLISVSAEEARELRERLGSVADRAGEGGSEVVERHARAAQVALDAVLATDYLTSR